MTISGSFRPSPRWAIAAAAMVAIVALQLAYNAAAPTGIDFISFWAAAKLVVAGTPALPYDIAAHRAVEATVATFDGQMTFPYPPPYFFLIMPFAFLPFTIGAMVWVALSLAVYALTVRKYLSGFGWAALAFPPVLVCGIIGQNGLLSAALIIAGLGLLGRRPFAAGLVFGLVAIKPQLAALIPLMLFATRDWRAIAGAVAGFAGICLISLAVFGIDPWKGFFGILPLYGELMAHGNVGWHRIASVNAALRLLGTPATPAIAIHATCALAAIWMVWRTGRDAALTDARGAALVIATALLSPYFYMYDQIVLIVAIAWAARSGLAERFIVHLYVISLLAFVLMIADEPRLNLVPLLPLALLGWLYWRTGEWSRLAGIFRARAARAQPA